MLSAVLGIVLPLGLLAFPAVRPTAAVATTLLIATFASLAAAYIQLGRDVATEPKEDRSEYLRSRWYRPFLAELDRQGQDLNRVGMFDTARFESALRSKDSDLFPGELLKALRSFVDHAKALNESAEALNRCVVVDMRTDPETKSLLGLPGREGGVTLAPPDLAEPALFEEWRRNYDRSPLTAILVETRGPSWSWDVATIPKPDTAEEKERLIGILQRFHERVVPLAEAAKFRAAKTDVNAAITRLRDQLRTVRGDGP